MEKKSLLYAIIVLLICNFITIIGWSKSIDQVNLYHAYYIAAEEFLDELDQHYDWVDAFDPEKYYEASDKLKNK